MVMTEQIAKRFPETDSVFEFEGLYHRQSITEINDRRKLRKTKSDQGGTPQCLKNR